MTRPPAVLNHEAPAACRTTYTAWQRYAAITGCLDSRGGVQAQASFPFSFLLLQSRMQVPGIRIAKRALNGDLRITDEVGLL